MRYRDTREEAIERTKRCTLTLRDLPKEQPIKVATFATVIGERTQAVKRRLMRIHLKEEDPVLVRIGDEWWIASMNRLRQVWHGLGERGLTVEELTEQLTESRDRERASQERNRDLRTEITRLRARQRATEKRQVELEESFVKATETFARLAPGRLERPVPSFADEVAREESGSGVRLLAALPATSKARSGGF